MSDLYDHIAERLEKPLAIRIFESTDGYHSCNDALDHLDARGPARSTKAAATRFALENLEPGRDPATVTIVNGCARTARKYGAHARTEG
jgi:hypothetical protein